MSQPELAPTPSHENSSESSRGESSSAPESIANSHILAYDEPLVDVRDTARYLFSNPGSRAKNYVISLFPIAQWIYRYNLQWLYGDLIAGITVGCVLVPQSMSYARIASLEPQYGLYSSFVGVIIYCFFATSKDVSIGPVAVMSLQTARVISHVVDKYPQFANDGHVIATTLALLCGSIALGIGLLRLGFLLEYVPIPAVMGFMTGSAFTIVVGQVPGLFGISKFLDTRAASYLVVVNTLKNLHRAKLDTAFGLVSLFWLYFIRWFCDFMAKRYPKHKRTFFFFNVLRAGIVIIIATLISWGVCRSHRKSGKFPISIIKTVPRGLQDVGVHKIDRDMVKGLATELPVSTVVLMLEHIAISKSFGRINDYKINPNQELIAIGVTNLIGQFFQAYPATGSFSRSALKAKCGVRTPLAGIFTGVCVLVAIYGLTEAFYWIPNAALSAIIIHAVGDLMADVRTSWKLWRVNPLEFFIFLGAVLLSVFVTLEAGIYFSIGSSIVWLLFRQTFPHGEFLGRVKYIEVFNPPALYSKQTGGQVTVEGEEIKSVKSTRSAIVNDVSHPEDYTHQHANGLSEGPFELLDKEEEIQQVNTQPTNDAKGKSVIPKVSSWSQPKYKWVPLSHKSINADLDIAPPPPGVFVFRPGESFTFPNASRQSDIIVDRVRATTRRGIDNNSPNIKLGDRPWNDHGPRKRVYDPNNLDTRPLLKAIFFDLSATPHIDLTGVQALADTRQELDKYANKPVEYHFIGILSPWARRALIAAGFGGLDNALSPSTPFIEISSSAASSSSALIPREKTDDEESLFGSHKAFLPVVGTNTPFFHLDIPDLTEFEE